MAVEVKVVQDPGEHFFASLFTQDGNWPLWCDKLFKDATPIKTVDDFVMICTQTASSQGKIDFIQINGHGNDTGFRIGNDRIDIKSIEQFKPKLATIAPLLNKNCSVELAACEAGKAVEVVRKFSQILGGVSIIGYVLSQNGGLAPVGPPVIISPGGSYSPPATAPGGYSRPNAPPPSR
jgi:hypothetical protein